MLVVVFGAGASYDSAPSYPPDAHDVPSRLPLSDDLFSNRPIIADALERYPRCHAIVPLLRDRQSGETVERVLERLRGEADEFPERHCQLAAIRYYLQFMLSECTSQWDRVARGIYNYKTLLDQIERWRHRTQEECVCLVTFNYDRLLEIAMRTVGVEIATMEHYVESPQYKVVKLHGSVDWGRVIEDTTESMYLAQEVRGLSNGQAIANVVIENAANLTISDRYFAVPGREHPISKVNNKVLFPAVAIPAESKNSFECPSEQLAALTQCLQHMTKLLVVGWRGTDAPFLALLRQHRPSGVPAMVVAGSEAASSTVRDNLFQGGLGYGFRKFSGGFTRLVLDRAVEDFLAD